MTPVTDPVPPLILCVDDDPEVLASIERVLHSDGFRTAGSTSSARALELLDQEVPDLVLLDIRMPEMDGYELCERILGRPDTENVPILFVTALAGEASREQAREAGGRMLLPKPFDRETLLETIRNLLSGRGAVRSEAEDEREAPRGEWADWVRPQTFDRFRGYLEARLPMGTEQRKRVREAQPHELYELSEELGTPPREMAEHVAEFLGVPHVSTIDPGHVDLTLLTSPFCRANLILPVRDEEAVSVVLSNPFDWELQETVQRAIRGKPTIQLLISEPESIRLFLTRQELRLQEEKGRKHVAVRGRKEDPATQPDRKETGRAIEMLTNGILRQAVSEGASDVHLEPKADRMLVRLRVDGDLTDMRDLSLREGEMLVGRFKALGRMDIAERRKPQDGAMEVVTGGRRQKLRLATTATPHGESLVIRILDPGVAPPTLQGLGLLPRQAELLEGMVSRSHGLVLVVGPTGSGKSTTIFSLLSTLRDGRRSVITVEDPVEYEMGFANQQQVHERAGATFEALLRSAVRQDPDVLLIGEIRDLFSAKAALDFSSSGHMTVSTIHSSNATTALFRLERLGVERGAMADALLGILAQKLVKVLCSACRKTRPIRSEEREWLAPFTDTVPETVAEPVGCPSCRQSGYRGREAVCELLEVDPEVAALVRDDASIARIRRFVGERGDFLMGRHAVEKVRDLALTPEDAHRLVLVEESIPMLAGAELVEDDVSAGITESAAILDPSSVSPHPHILVVEDDRDQRLLVERHLTNAGYLVSAAEDGVDALMKLGQEPYDLVLSDINMPNLDGLKLLELLSQREVEIPVVFLSAESGDTHELRGFELGAVDYLHKPISKDVLHLRIARALGHAPGWTPGADSGAAPSPSGREP